MGDQPAQGLPIDVQLEAMQSEMPSTDVRLLDKRPATKGLQTFLRDTLQTAPEVPCYQGRRAVQGGGFTCQPGDVVVYRLQGVDEVAQISFHAQVGDSSCITCINPWRHVHAHMYEVRQEPTLIYTSAIQSCCIWLQKERNGATSVKKTSQPAVSVDSVCEHAALQMRCELCPAQVPSTEMRRLAGTWLQCCLECCFSTSWWFNTFVFMFGEGPS